MGKRKRIGFIFSYNENWIAGTYYILNIINALKIVEDNKKPDVIIFTEEENNIEIVKKETAYPYLSFFLIPKDLNIIKRGINKITRIADIEVFPTKIKNPQIDFLYPNQHPKIINDKLKKVFWIPDFQEEFLPELFSASEIQKRKNLQRHISENGDLVVFSSKDALGHFDNLYPNSRISKFVLNFAVTHPDLSELKSGEILKKYRLDKPYFFSPNQFWAHKNHMVTLKAVEQLKIKGIEITVAFSGKENDHRNRDYVIELKSFIEEKGLNDNIVFLGFMDRKEQLVVLKQSIAVIQPSLFEGWSTVIEDAKACNKHIILSDLPVHYEQVSENCNFFERTNEQQLAMLLHKLIKNGPDESSSISYDENIKKFALDFINLINLAC